MKRFVKGILCCLMLAATVIPSMSSIKAEGNTAGQPEETEKTPLDQLRMDVYAGQKDNVYQLNANSYYQAVITKIGATGDDMNLLQLDDYYTFDATISENLNSTELGNGRYQLAPTKLGDATISIKVTDKENSELTKTFTANAKINKGSQSITNTKDPINGSDLIDEIKGGTSDRLHVSLDPEKTTSISKDVFTAAKEEGVDLVISSFKSNGTTIHYSFDAADLDDTTINFNPNFEIGVTNEDVNAIVPENAKPLVVEFAHHGNLPGKATVTVAMNREMVEEYKGITELYLYHVDNASGKLVYSGKASVGYGAITFEITHCSQYALTTVELNGDQTTLPAHGLDDVPNTGI